MDQTSQPPRRSQNQKIRIAGRIAAVLAVAAAILLLVLPVPVQDIGVFNDPVYCGPGATTDNALQIMADPQRVNTDPGVPIAKPANQAEADRETARKVHNVEICQSAAKTRFVWAAVAVMFAVVVGLAVPSILKENHRG
ncbi:hypothetical protein [Amycolatopsis sp. CFH S0078]|uniref:hypothetical protein n=1 Tax=Amycolatopsis sp. CFH S0078 TaxID=1644108 RepID=UPI00106EB033|nr:hypothetical protein [Amycolatopsis sp. CFH S0078]